MARKRLSVVKLAGSIQRLAAAARAVRRTVANIGPTPQRTDEPAIESRPLPLNSLVHQPGPSQGSTTMRATTSTTTVRTGRWGVAVVAIVGLVAGSCDADETGGGDTNATAEPRPRRTRPRPRASAPVGTTVPPPGPGCSRARSRRSTPCRSGGGCAHQRRRGPSNPTPRCSSSTHDVNLWMFSDPVALLASPPGTSLSPTRRSGFGRRAGGVARWAPRARHQRAGAGLDRRAGRLPGRRCGHSGSTSRSPTCPPAEVCVDPCWPRPT